MVIKKANTIDTFDKNQYTLYDDECDSNLSTPK